MTRIALVVATLWTVALLAEAGPAAAVAPPLPPGCGSVTTSTLGQDPSADIADGGGEPTSSTLRVSGVDHLLWDVDVRTFVRHPNSSDIDMTLTSPAGTHVTLSTDNGGSNDDVFDGTVWDDRANPGGPLTSPATSANDGLASDSVYADGVTEEVLAPEEPLAAFRGEDPNGVWTLTVDDDLANALTGTLDAWRLTIATQLHRPSLAAVSSAVASPVAIPDNNATPPIEQSVVHPASGSVAGVRLTTDVPHVFAADLDMTLTSPAGTVATVSTDNGGSTDNVFAGSLFDVRANPGGLAPYITNAGLTTDHPYSNLVTASPLAPEESFDVFTGEEAAGTWKLHIDDDAAGDLGTLDSWSVEIATGQCNPSADVAVEASATPSDVVAGGAVAYAFTASNRSGDHAGSVNLAFALPDGAELLSAAPSQGTCSGATCSLGTIEAGRSAGVVLVARLHREGANVASATISSETPDPDPSDNAAQAIAQVVRPAGAGAPPPPAAADGAPRVVILTPARVRRRAALRGGLSVLFAVTEAATVRVEALLPPAVARRLRLGRRVAVATRRTSSAASGKVRLRFGARARRLLAKQRGLRLTIRTTATDSAGNVARTTRRVTLR